MVAAGEEPCSGPSGSSASDEVAGRAGTSHRRPRKRRRAPKFTLSTIAVIAARRGRPSASSAAWARWRARWSSWGRPSQNAASARASRSSPPRGWRWSAAENGSKASCDGTAAWRLGLSPGWLAPTARTDTSATVARGTATGSGTGVGDGAGPLVAPRPVQLRVTEDRPPGSPQRRARVRCRDSLHQRLPQVGVGAQRLGHSGRIGTARPSAGPTVAREAGVQLRVGRQLTTQRGVAAQGESSARRGGLPGS